jgi:hypothetical protein
MTCIVCIREAGPKNIYCPRCWGLIKNKHDHVEHREVLIKYYDRELDGFVCFWTGVKLNDTDPNDPWYLTFDHLVPGKKGTMVPAAWWVNDMREDMDEDEFRTVVSLFARHSRGEPVDWELVKFVHWNRKQRPRLFGIASETAVAVTPDKCAICIRKPRPHSIYCPRCRHLVFEGRDILQRHAALVESYDEAVDEFICKYTGVRLDDADFNSPWHVTFDHCIPGKKGKLAVTATFINAMKTDLSEEEFLAVMAELDRHFNGAPFNKNIIKFEYWHRTVDTS